MRCLALAAITVLAVSLLAAPAHALEGALVGHWAGDLEHEGRSYPIRLDISCDGEAYSLTLDLPEYLIYGSSVEVTGDDAQLTIQPHVFDETRLTVQLEDGALRGQWEGFQDVTSDVVLRRAGADPVLYVEEDVTFENGDGVLKGTLLRPVGAGPFPTIVWTHGSGPDTRQTFYYSGRAHLMAQHGVASLIYDKRGAGQSSGTRSWDSSVLIEDALAAVAAIEAHAAVDTSAIGIAGFSQGGWIAPAVAARDADVDFVLVGATPGVTGGEQNIFSMANRMRRDDESVEDVEAAERFVRRLYEFYETGEDRAGAAAALESAQSASWFKNKWLQNILHIPDGGLPEGRHPYWTPFSPDPMDNWRQVHVPVLSMWGADDIDVPVETSRQKIEQTLKGIGNTNFHFEVFPNASHGLWQKKDPALEWDWPRQAPGSHQLMVDWVLEQTGG